MKPSINSQVLVSLQKSQKEIIKIIYIQAINKQIRRVYHSKKQGVSKRRGIRMKDEEEKHHHPIIARYSLPI
jgi:hypothetical protein